VCFGGNATNPIKVAAVIGCDEDDDGDRLRIHAIALIELTSVHAAVSRDGTAEQAGDHHSRPCRIRIGERHSAMLYEMIERTRRTRP
jgi:hypothetical protein